ncbi:hypothetical protein [Spirosoma sp. KNUC1025]|uniref:hypothetical protein n=1 Tax=Spirosoma sp. KNUC1025 TaxID=2894082 RepID=UPI003863DF71|nr:hypothetical protein LN737_20285 [Spirosoma sp. KNUC1025]
MKNVLFLGAMLTVMTCFDSHAQSTNTNNASTVGSAVTNDPSAVGNDKTRRSQATQKRSTGATVDGSNGGATNDGASGQSGAPAPLPATSTQASQSVNQNKTSRNMKSSRKTSSSSAKIGSKP